MKADQSNFGAIPEKNALTEQTASAEITYSVADPTNQYTSKDICKILSDKFDELAKDTIIDKETAADLKFLIYEYFFSSFDFTAHDFLDESDLGFDYEY